MREAVQGKCKVFILMVCCVFVCILTGCGMQTDMKISDEFAGERTIVCDKLSDSALMFSSAKVTDVTESLQKNCPAGMEFSCKYTSDKKTEAVYTFKIKFTDIEDYKSKVAAILGRTPKVEFVYQSPEEQLFKSGFSLSEDFNSTDLLVWVKSALKKDLNISQDLSSFTDTVSVTMNGTKYDNQNLMSSRIKIDTVAAYKLDNVAISTTRYGDDDYEREIILSMPQKTVETLGKDNISKFLQSAAAEGMSCKWLSDEKNLSRYSISFSGTAEVINICTSAIFSGSSFSYVKDESLYTAFSETGVLKEKIIFDKFPCENDGSCNADITYKNMDSCLFDGEKSTLRAAEKAVKGEGISEDGKTITLCYRKAAAADIKPYSSTVYKLSEVDVITSIKSDDRVSVSIVLASPVDTYDYGAQFAAAYFTKQLKDSGIDVSVGQFNQSGSQYAVTLSTPVDTAENVTALLQKYIGGNNSVTIEGKDKFALYNNRNISVSVDVADFIKSSGYTGEIMYGFNGSGQVYDVDWSSAGGGKSDILMGQYRSNEFEHPISAHTFTITYHLRRINVVFVLLISALVIVVLGAVIMCCGWLALRSRRKRNSEKLAAVQTMALVKLPDGTETMMEIPADEAANTVVLAPKNDDGLDEDDDEPENVWLFGTALKLLTVICSVLFFLSFVTITWTDVLAKTKSVSGLDMSRGIDLMERTLEGDYVNFILFVIPLVMLGILCMRRYFPKLAANLAIIGLSAFQIWYLLGLPQTFEEQVYAFGAEVGKRFTMELGWAYNYSVMIYAMLLLGGVVLLVVDTGIAVRRGVKRREHDVK
ncbi:MAG: hypothetical protein PUB37_08190 [Firmicutes bacterium]|nr:hypothetical protein [Bacillota bacterium]